MVTVLEPSRLRALPATTTVARWQRRYVQSVLLLDLLIAALAAAVAPTVQIGGAGYPPTTYLVGSLLFPVLWVLFAAASRAYEERFLGSGSEEYRRVFNAAVRYGALVASVGFGFAAPIPRSYILIAFPLATVGTLCGRYLARQTLKAARRKGRCQHRVLLVGTERSISELVRQVRRDVDSGFTVVGACLDRSSGRDIDGVPVVGTSATIVDALVATHADTVAVTAWSILSQHQMRRLAWQLEGSAVDVLVAPAITDIAGPRIHIRPVAGLPLLHVEQPEFTGSRRLLKGGFDRLMALAVLLVISPAFVAIALAVRLTSPGPAFFRQNRVGKHGLEFPMLKFRSMVVNAEQELAHLQEQNEGDGVLFKMRNDPRVTKVGAVLRRYSLDELPQLINVLLGQMSLVGPRPPLPSEVRQYGDDVSRRLLVKPGLTGLWQVSGRSDLSWDESVRLDLDYVENWSLALDLSIIWKTFSAVLARRGAY
ncbi:MAG: sugar transferase [Actinomycetota bacterium]|nr:sugar transferase [Actinomycetota bacterium]